MQDDALGCPARRPGVGGGDRCNPVPVQRAPHRQGRNLAADPRVVVHLESGEDVVIVRGTAEDLGAPGQSPEVVAALAAKYAGESDRQYMPDADPDFDVVYGLRPRSAMMWRLADYEGSQRHWRS